MINIWLIIAATIAIVFLISYCKSTVFHYYVRISFFYFTILLHGMECCVTMIPSYIQKKGADYVFNSFYYWTRWTGVNLTVRGFENTQIDGPAVVVCNHQSSLDVIPMSAIWPKRCTVMMKKVLAYVPFFNLSSFLANTIFIDRFNRDKAMKSIDYCVSELQSKGLKLWVFPEGTRNRKGGLMVFKKGAFNIAVRANIPIIPVVISDYSPFYSKSLKYFKNDGEVIVEALDPISSEGLTYEDVPDLAEKVRQRMLVVYEKISIEAKQLMNEKRKNKSS